MSHSSALARKAGLLSFGLFLAGLFPVALPAVGPAPLEVCYINLEHNLREAEMIYLGTIIEIIEPRRPGETGFPDDLIPGLYRLEVETVFRGAAKPGDRVVVVAEGNWTCETRRLEYRVGQRLLLFLKKDDWGTNPPGILRPYAGMQSERVLEDGRVRLTEAEGGTHWRAEEFLEALPVLLRFIQVPRDGEFEAWLELLRHENPEVRRFALERVNEVDLIYADWPEMEGKERVTLEQLDGEQKVTLFRVLVDALDADREDERTAAREAVVRLWLEMRRLEGEARSEAERLRARAAAVILEQSRELPEPRRFERICTAARLEEVSVLDAVLEAMGSPEAARRARAWRALLSLRRVAPVRSRRVLARLAAELSGGPYETELGRTAVTIVNDKAHPQSISTRGVPSSKWAELFRRWWKDHAAELPD